MKRRAQAGGGAAATLIGIIALLLIFYILFLPPEERKELLKEEEEILPPGIVPEGGEIIFKAAPGRLTYVGQTEFEHVLPNLMLSEERQAKVLAETAPFVIKKGWFKKQFKNISAYLPNLETVDNVFISFQTPVRRGRLKILFNGAPVFEGTINVQNPPPVPVPKSLLKAENNIEFQVWGFGLIFSREYDIEDVKVIGEITDVKKQEASNSFGLPETEYSNIESAYLAFFPICDQNTVGVLDIMLNNKVIYSAVPVCDSPAREDLFKEDFAAGKNTLGFKLRAGTARIEQIKVKTFVKPTKGWSDFFFIKPEIFTAIAIGKAHAILDIEFVDDGTLKEAATNLNGRLDILTQRSPKYTRDISDVVRDGNNFIGIEPGTDINIMSLTVRVE
ncbi:MAG: hypothetical protein QXK08_02030 [Candidatus Woesearchaeota archaeon]